MTESIFNFTAVTGARSELCLDFWIFIYNVCIVNKSLEELLGTYLYRIFKKSSTYSTLSGLKIVNVKYVFL